MPKYCSENERVKRNYAFYLEAANGKQNATIDAALRAIERFEISTNQKPFRKFHVEQARSFRARLFEEVGPTGKPLSAATITSTLKHLRNFFLWLSREPGFRQAINANDANYFTPSEQDIRIATARREKHVASLEEIKQVLALSGTRCGRRIFILSAGIDQIPASRSRSAHSAARSSPGRTKVRASNSSAAHVSGAPS